MMRCIDDLNNYALTGHTSVYNEDGLTAQSLIMKSAKKTRECLGKILSLEDGFKTLQAITTVDGYEGEELQVSNKLEIKLKPFDQSSRFYFLLSENSQSLIELASNIAKGITQGLQKLEELTPTLLELEGSSDELTALKTQLDCSYVCTFDEESFTLLELAGNTAKGVNEFVKSVNMFITYVDNLSGPVTFIEDDEMLELKATADNEELKI